MRPFRIIFLLKLIELHTFLRSLHTCLVNSIYSHTRKFTTVFLIEKSNFYLKHEFILNEESMTKNTIFISSEQSNIEGGRQGIAIE